MCSSQGLISYYCITQLKKAWHIKLNSTRFSNKQRLSLPVSVDM